MYRYISPTEIQCEDNPLYLEDGRVISNPTYETLTDLGFKELIPVERPDEESQVRYYDDGEVIHMVWIMEASE